MAISTIKNATAQMASITESLADLTSQINIIKNAETGIILEQPDNFVCEYGDTVTLRVVALNIVSYQWKKISGNTVSNSGATGNKTDTLTWTYNSNNDGYSWRCDMVDVAGNTFSSDTVTKVTAVIPSGETVDPGNSEVISVTGLQNTIAELQTALAALSTRITTIENASIGIILEQPTDATISAVGDAVTFHVTALNAANYTWQAYYSDSWHQFDATGQGTDTLTVTTNASNISYQFRCMITDINGGTFTTNTVNIILAT